MVNSELLKLARAKFEKSAVVPSDAAMGMGGENGAMPYMNQQLGAVTPEQAAAGAAPPPGDPMQDPTGAAAAAMPPAAAPAPAPAAPAAPAAAPGQQKLKPEQMMQMIDFRMYNMQQQLTAIMNAMGVQVDPATLVLPPGSNGAPPAESALPGGPMAPPAQDPNAPAGPQDPGAPMPPGGPQDPSQPPMDPNAGKQAWWDRAAAELTVIDPERPTETQLKAAALTAVFRSLERAR